jgi:hypothetical protein
MRPFWLDSVVSVRCDLRVNTAPGTGIFEGELRSRDFQVSLAHVSDRYFDIRSEFRAR